MRLTKNNLLPWFIQDHGTLPDAYLRSCEKFFKELSIKQQAPSNKLIQKNLHKPGTRVKNRFNRKI